LAIFPANQKGEPAIDFVVEKAQKKKPVLIASKSAPQKKEEMHVQYGIDLHDNYHFDTFFNGPSNQFAKSTAVTVAAKPGKTYNPLFIHGGVGLGKTHLLHAVGHAVKEKEPKKRVHCITTEAFVNELVDGFKNRNVDILKRFYRKQVDVLLIDDIQFLENRRNFEEELCNTFEALIHQGKQIVLTCDKPPSELDLSERIIARMEWGLVTRIETPDMETRVAILQHKAIARGITLPDEIAFYLANHLKGSVRQLEGAINRLCAHSHILQADINKTLVKTALKEMLKEGITKEPSIDQILQAVAKHFEVKVEDLLGKSKKNKLAFPRQIAMFLSCKLTEHTLQTLSDAFQKKHSTIVYARKCISKKMEDDSSISHHIEMIEKKL